MYICKLFNLIYESGFYPAEWTRSIIKSKKISNDQELIQSDPISCPQNQKGNN